MKPRNPGRVDAICKLAGCGLTAAQIAERLGDLSRAAVLGIVRRNKIELAGARVSPSTSVRNPSVRRMASGGTRRFCAWRIGHGPSSRPCGCAATPGEMWCGEHLVQVNQLRESA